VKRFPRPLWGLVPAFFLLSVYPGSLVAQPDRASFVTAPYIERARQAGEEGDWPEVVRYSEQALRRAEGLVEARELLIRGLIGLREYVRAEQQSLLLPRARRDANLAALRQAWIEHGSPGADALLRWRGHMPASDWEQTVQTVAFRQQQRTGNERAAGLLTTLYEQTGDPAVARLATTYLATQSPTPEERDMLLLLQRRDELDGDQAERLSHVLVALGHTEQAMQLLRDGVDSGAAWYDGFRAGLLGRLIFEQRLSLAKDVIQLAWDRDNMPAPVRSQLVELAMATEDTGLMAQPDLRPPEQCLDSVAWLGERDPGAAGQLLTACEENLDPRRWQYLASLYNPDLLPSLPGEPTPAEREALAAAEAEFRRRDRALARAQRLQDAVDDAYRGQCQVPDDAEYDPVRNEIRAICLRDEMPGAASVYFEQVLRDEAHPRRGQLLREAAYNAYQAGGYEASINYWRQVDEPLTGREQNALDATREALEAARRGPADGEVSPALSLAELRVLARQQPGAHGLELGLRLAGADNGEEREAAIAWLEQAARRDPYDFRIPETLAYRYHEAGRPAEARTQARRAVDSMYTDLAVDETTSEELRGREFALRRTHEFLTQRNRLYVGTTWSRFGVPSAIGAQTGDSAFQLASFEHLLGDEPTTAGRQLGLYARALSSSASHDRIFHDPAWGVGLRWKPWGRANVNTFAEIFRPSDGDTDLMLRTSANLLDGGALRDDWRPLENGWHWQSLFLDAAYFIRANDYQLYASYIRGYDFRLSETRPHALAPYVTFFSGQSNDFSDTGAGLGLRYRHWFSGDRYNAWRNRVDLRFELSRSVAGDRRNTDGWRIIMEWQL